MAHRVLVVDDNRVNLMLLSEMLQGSCSCEVLTAESGEEALVTFGADANFDAIFTDVNMPGGMSGEEFARQVRKLNPQVPIFFCTAHHHYRPPGDLMGKHTFVMEKPYDVVGFVSTISGFLHD